MQTSAKEVLAQVARDLKSRGLTHEDIARDLKYKTRQSVGTILTSNRYMTQAQARRFSETYGYYYDFLVSGAGSLTGPAEDEGTTFFLPKYALLLTPFENYGKFQEAYEVLLRGMIASYGAKNVQRFLNGTIRYVSLLDNPEEEWARSQQTVDGGGILHDPHVPAYGNQDHDFIRRNIEATRDLITRSLYDTYNEMVAKDFPHHQESQNNK